MLLVLDLMILSVCLSHNFSYLKLSFHCIKIFLAIKIFKYFLVTNPQFVYFIIFKLIFGIFVCLFKN